MNEKLLDVKINQKIKQYEAKKKLYKEIQRAPICLKCIYFLFPCFQTAPPRKKRAIFLNDERSNIISFSNKEINTKYNFFSFIPLVLLNQFRFFGNQFYLLMTLSQFINVLKVGFLFSYLAPLLIVLTTTLIKEFFDEMKRYSQDKITNNENFTKIILKGNKIINVNVKAKDISVGDKILLKSNQRAPADLVILTQYSSRDFNKTIYIRTDQLDGETDWKLRKAPHTYSGCSSRELFTKDSMIEVEASNKQIYDFKGAITLHTNNDEIVTESLGYENTIWANCVLATEDLITVVIYSGKETKAKLNSNKAKFKVGALDNEINLLNKVLFVIMIVLSLVVSFFKESTLSFKIIIFFRFIVLFCGIIPISLRVNLDLSKTYFSYKINNDHSIKNTIVRNSTIPEDLGRISVVFTDKTGTLTKNEMIFRKFATRDIIYTSDYRKESRTSSFSGCSSFQDIQNSSTIEVVRIDTSNESVYKCLLAMVLCNNVLPVKEKNGKVTFQSSSPDEISLIEFAKKLDFIMKSRNDKEIEIQTSKGDLITFEIMVVFPFSSETKRMGIVLKNKSSNELTFYVKGAENKIMKFINDKQINNIIERRCEDLSNKGLRTLVLAQKEIEEQYFNSWKKKYDNACASMEDRKQNIEKVVSELENDMEFLCVTGVEDLLQDEINITIQSLRDAGMKIWMLTGDKKETAKCISISTGIKPDQKEFYEIDYSIKNPLTEEIQSISNQLGNYMNLQKKENNKYILIIGGEAIDICLSHLEKKFYQASLLSDSVICCRCSPTQKSTLVKIMKKYTPYRTMAIGDGGNDVAMIQEADVGIGIVGKEGLHASLSSDFSITKFSKIRNLLLWWGRVAYKNTSTMSNFVIHRGLIISFIQCIFTIVFYFNAVALYNGMLILGYGTLYTNFPAMSILLDYDIDSKNVFKCPSLYKALLKGRELSMKVFISWLWKSIFQATVIMIGSILAFEENIYLKIVTVTFTELIFAEILNVYSSIKSINRPITVILFLSLLVYILSLLFLRSILDAYFVFDFYTMSRIILIAFSSWFPIYMFHWIKRKCFPSEIDILEKKIQNKNKITI